MAAANEPHSGRKADKIIRDALLGAARSDPERMKRTAVAIWMKAEAGDVAAFKEIADRIDGKAVQQIAGSDEHAPVSIALTSTITPEQIEAMQIAAAIKGLHGVGKDNG